MAIEAARRCSNCIGFARRQVTIWLDSKIPLVASLSLYFLVLNLSRLVDLSVEFELSTGYDWPDTEYPEFLPIPFFPSSPPMNKAPVTPYERILQFYSTKLGRNLSIAGQRIFSI